MKITCDIEHSNRDTDTATAVKCLFERTLPWDLAERCHWSHLNCSTCHRAISRHRCEHVPSTNTVPSLPTTTTTTTRCHFTSVECPFVPVVSFILPPFLDRVLAISWLHLRIMLIWLPTFHLWQTIISSTPITISVWSRCPVSTHECNRPCCHLSMFQESISTRDSRVSFESNRTELHVFTYSLIPLSPRATISHHRCQLHFTAQICACACHCALTSRHNSRRESGTTGRTRLPHAAHWECIGKAKFGGFRLQTDSKRPSYFRR